MSKKNITVYLDGGSAVHMLVDSLSVTKDRLGNIQRFDYEGSDRHFMHINSDKIVAIVQSIDTEGIN